MINYAIITAGGRGERLPGDCKKQFMRLAGVPLFLWPVARFLRHPQVGRVVLVLPKDDYGLGRELLEDELLSLDSGFADRLWFTFGGGTRQQSVFNGLQMCPPDAALVLIHDGVRPFVQDDDITRLMAAAEQTGAAIPVHEVKHTVKEVRGNRVTRTLDRTNLVEVFTPQVFRYADILACHERARADGLDLTDDAGLCERYGYPVAAVRVSSDNIKITDPVDLLLAEQMVRQRGEKLL